MPSPVTTQPVTNVSLFAMHVKGSKRTDQLISMQHYHNQAQPGRSSINCMPSSASNFTNCLPGLEYLAMTDHLLVSQKPELLEVFTGWESNNKYAIVNQLGQQIYFAKEENDCCTRGCFGKMRPFQMSIVDNMQHEVIHISRPLACMDCCYPCCLQSMEVSSPVGKPIGYVKQEWAFCKPEFRIMNKEHETVLRIEGPVIACACCGDVDFQILSTDGKTPVGKICKQWSGMAKEILTDADNFGIQFPANLTVEGKATLLAATFLIDFMYFEDNK